MKITPKTSSIIHVMVGTAGHVDHGKTALVRSLTGCDTDRLPEEKARGMSIDLGFAPCILTDKRLVGIIDVPGHEDFIRNMVAGAASIDVLLLVIAADDGVMPQTDEHLRIVRFLRTPRVMVALTKKDLVDADALALAVDDVKSFLAREGYPDAPVVPCSNVTLEGIVEVREALETLIEEASKRPPDRRAFRMNVERVFSVKGFGAVAAGIPASGEVRVDDKLELLPDAAPAAVRSIQTYKVETDRALANTCTAINLRGVDAGTIRRGMTLAAPGVYRPAAAATLTVRGAADWFFMKKTAEVRFHAGTAVVAAKVRLIDAEKLAPGVEAFMQAALEEPLTFAAGDRYIIRSLTPPRTVGGGVVLSARASRRRRTLTGEMLARLMAARAAVDRGDFFLSELLAGTDPVVTNDEMIRFTQLPAALAAEAIADKTRSGDIIDLDGGAWLVTAWLPELAESLQRTLERYHREHPYQWGMTPALVCDPLGIGAKNFASLAERLAASGPFAVRHGRLALAAFKPPVTARQMQQRDELINAVQSAGINALARGNLLKQLDISESDLKILTRMLIDEGRVKLLGPHLLHAPIFADCRDRLFALLKSQEIVTLDAFRLSTGASRNLAVAMLEAFDAEGITKRVEGGRVSAP
jgi:selenocysteine-specific elongation factor